MMSRRIFTAALAAASMGTLEAATGMLMPRLARAENGSAAHNVVLVHGLTRWRRRNACWTGRTGRPCWWGIPSQA